MRIFRHTLRDLADYVADGKTVDQVSIDLENKHQQSLLAVQRTTQRSEILINPREKLELESGDQCFLIAWDPPEREK